MEDASQEPGTEPAQSLLDDRVPAPSSGAAQPHLSAPPPSRDPEKKERDPGFPVVPGAFEALRQSQPLPASLSLTFHSHDHPLSTSVIPESGLLLGLGAHATASVTAGSMISHNPGPSHTRAWSPQTCPKTHCHWWSASHHSPRLSQRLSSPGWVALTCPEARDFVAHLDV